MKNPTATIVSYVLHPLLVPTYIIALLMNLDVFMAFMIPISTRLFIIGMIFVMTFALPVIMIYMMHRRGIIASMQMEDKSERFFPLLVTALFWFLGYNLISKTGLPLIYYKYMIGGLGAIIIAMPINYFWKISLHMLGMGGLTGVFIGLLYTLGIEIFPLLAIIILLSGLTGYARLKENSHNPPQIYAGYIVGVFLMLIVYLYPFI